MIYDDDDPMAPIDPGPHVLTFDMLREHMRMIENAPPRPPCGSTPENPHVLSPTRPKFCIVCGMPRDMWQAEDRCVPMRRWFDDTNTAEVFNDRHGEAPVLPTERRTSRAEVVRSMEIEHALKTKRVITSNHLSVVTWDDTSDAYVLQHCPTVPGVREDDGVLILGLDQLESLRDIVTEAAAHHDDH